jgi:hypothetical protein
MKRFSLITLFLFSFAAGVYAGEAKAIYRVLRFNPSEVGIYCTNGADPTAVAHDGPVLTISCGH